MKYCARFLVLLLFLIPLQIFGEIKFSLSKTVIDKGEPLYAYFEIDGSPEVEITRKVVTQNGVTAEYIGQEDNITANNFEVSRKKIIKFRIVTAKSGNHEIPEITILVDGQKIHSKHESFKVTKNSYKPPRPNRRGFNSIFDQFFQDDPFTSHSPFLERGYITPREDDLFVRFEASKSKIYVGETIVGYFLVYYRDMNQPMFGRNQTVSLDFPYFVNELLHDISISVPNQTQWKGQSYYVLPYDKEVYALTSLRPGVYRIGEAKFEAEGNISSYFPPVSLDSKTQKIEVLELPKPKPKDFSGEVGDYDIDINLDKTSTKVNGSVSFNIVIHGEGSGSLFKDPLKNVCQDPRDCNASITLVNEHNSKKFTKLKSGDYGFTSETVFYYSLYPREEGKLEFPSIKIVYFNPNSHKYETKIKKMPKINVKEREKRESKQDVLPKFQDYTRYILFAGLLLFGFGIIFVFRYKIMTFMDYVLEQTNSFVSQSPTELEYTDRIIGNKKGTLLKNYFLEKGLNRYRVNELVDIKSHYKNASFVEIYRQLDGKRKKYLLNMVKELLKEEKL